MSNIPRVSVVIPLYNGSRYIEESIRSALMQTFDDIEIIVIDDGSTDGSGNIADQLADAYPGKIHVIHQPNFGLPSARNSGFAHARGEFIALLDADDIWLPNHLLDVVKRFEQDHCIALVHANYVEIDAIGNRLLNQARSGRWRLNNNDAWTSIFLRDEHIACPTAVFRRSCVHDIGGMDVAFAGGCEDRDYWLRISARWPIAYIDDIHALYRIHSQGMSRKIDRMFQARLDLLNKHGRSVKGLPLWKRAHAAILTDRGDELRSTKQPLPAILAYAKAISLFPATPRPWKSIIATLIRKPV